MKRLGDVDESALAELIVAGAAYGGVSPTR